MQTNAFISTHSCFNAIRLLIYYLLTYYCNLWLSLNIVWRRTLTNRTCSTFGIAWIRASLTVDMCRSTMLCDDKHALKTEWWIKTRHEKWKRKSIRNQKLLTSLMILKLYCYLCFSGIFCSRCSCQAHLCTAVSVDCHRAQQVLNNHQQNIKVYRCSRHIWVCTAQFSYSGINFGMNQLMSIIILALWV